MNRPIYNIGHIYNMSIPIGIAHDNRSSNVSRFKTSGVTTDGRTDRQTLPIHHHHHHYSRIYSAPITKKQEGLAVASMARVVVVV